MFSWRVVVTLCAALAVLPSYVRAQVLYGSLVGNVTDESGAVIAGAGVKILHTASNQSREFTTNDDGGYTLSSVPAGDYVLTVTKPGFQQFIARNIAVDANSVVR